MGPVVSCFTNSYGRFGAREAIDHVPSLGIRHLELPIRTCGKKSLFGDTPLLTDVSLASDLAEVQDLLAEQDLNVISCNISSGNPGDDDVLEITLRKLELAAELGVALVVGGAGEVTDKISAKRIFRNFEAISERCEAWGITYCCETHPGLCVNADAMLETMKSIGHRSIRLNFDTANLIYYNEDIDVLKELKRVQKFVRHVHLKDSSGKFQDWNFAALGEGGAVDFVEIRKILEKARYTGPYSIELEGIGGESPPTLEEVHRRMAVSVAHLSSCGYTF